MLARADEGGRATVRNARLAHRFRVVSYELATSSKVAAVCAAQRPRTLNKTLLPQ